MICRAALRRAVNRSAGRRFAPLARPPPPGADRLCGLHAVRNALRAFAAGHPHRRRPRRLFVRDFAAEKDKDKDKDKEKEKEKEGDDERIPAAYANLRRVVRLARALRVEVEAVERRELVQLCGERRHQNVVLEASSFEPHSVVACPARPANLLYLDHVMDPANVGAIARSAFFFGLRDIVLSSDCAGCTPAVSRASAGLVEHMRIYRSAVPTVEFIANTQAQAQARVMQGTRNTRGEQPPLHIIAATAHMPRNALQDERTKQKESRVDDANGHVRRLLLLGNESAGLSRSVMALCTHAVHIPLIWAPPLPEVGENDVEDNDDSFIESEEAETDGKRAKGASRKWDDVLRAPEVSLNVSAASAVLLAALTTGGGAARICPVTLQK